MATCDIDGFAVALTEIIEDMNNKIYAQLPGAVQKASIKGRQKATEEAKSAGWHHGVTAGRYDSGFRQHMIKGGRAPEAEIGNRIAGLVHLLEKAHVIKGGGKTRAFVHMMPAKEAANEELIKRCEEAVDNAL